MDLYCWSSGANGSQTIDSPYAPEVGTPTWVTQNAGKINPTAANAAHSLFKKSSSLIYLALLPAIAILIL